MRIHPRHLLRLYPRVWRERYGDEFIALLEQEGTRPRVVIDVLAGAFDAWVSPRPSAGVADAAWPIGPMGPQIIFLRSARAPRTKADLLRQFRFGAAVFVVLLGLSGLLHAAVRETWLGAHLARGAIALAWVMSFAPFAFRNYPKRTQLAAAFWMGVVMISVARLLTWLWP